MCCAVSPSSFRPDRHTQLRRTGDAQKSPSGMHKGRQAGRQTGAPAHMHACSELGGEAGEMGWSVRLSVCLSVWTESVCVSMWRKTCAPHSYTARRHTSIHPSSYALHCIDSPRSVDSKTRAGGRAGIKSFATNSASVCGCVCGEMGAGCKGHSLTHSGHEYK